jgi:hypothetical protein
VPRRWAPVVDASIGGYADDIILTGDHLASYRGEKHERSSHPIKLWW